MTYTAGISDDGLPFITCNICGKTSYHPEDISNRYCGSCHTFHDPEGPAFFLLPCAPDVCQECAAAHPSWQAHNAESLYYKYKFYGDHGRWPTWEDAIAHCTDRIKGFWRGYLREKGIDI